MRPFLLEFLQIHINTVSKNSLLEYSTDLHLNVIKGTLKPAIDNTFLVTETATKVSNEASDSDRDFNLRLRGIVVTQTGTFETWEQSDRDK